MTSEHLEVLLDSPADMHLFFRAAEMLARGEVPDGVARIIRRGRMTALPKSAGGVREIVAGDFVRKLVAKTISQQFSQCRGVSNGAVPVRVVNPRQLRMRGTRTASVE